MRLARTRRKLAMWSALYPYLGGKRRLCPVIFREIDHVVPRRLWPELRFLDAFLGGGSVALYAKAQGFRVIASDVAERAIVVGRALIENSRVKLTREDTLRLAALADDPPGRIERDYAPQVFTQAQARFLDRALKATTTDPTKAALYVLLAIRVALKAHPMSQVRAGTIQRVTAGGWESVSERCVRHYVDGPRLTHPDKLWKLAQQINAGVFEGKGEVMKANIMKALPTIQADVAYFDPPYPGTMAHEREYRVLDEILDGAPHPISPFSAKDGASLVDELLEKASHIPIWVLSFGNAVTGVDDLVAKMQTFGRSTRATEIKHAHKVSVASKAKNEVNREFLVVGWDEASPLLRGTSEKIREIPDRQPEAFVDLGPRGVELDLKSRGATGAGLHALPHEAVDEREPGLFEDQAGGAARAPEATVGGD